MGARLPPLVTALCRLCGLRLLLFSAAQAGLAGSPAGSPGATSPTFFDERDEEHIEDVDD